MYVDTKYKTADSVSNSEFKIELQPTLSFQDNSVFCIDDVSMPHSWYVIEKDINDVSYIQIIPNKSIIDEVCAVKIDPGNYNGVDLAIELMRENNNMIDIPGIHFLFIVTYSVKNQYYSV